MFWVCPCCSWSTTDPGEDWRQRLSSLSSSVHWLKCTTSWASTLVWTGAWLIQICRRWELSHMSCTSSCPTTSPPIVLDSFLAISSWTKLWLSRNWNYSLDGPFQWHPSSLHSTSHSTWRLEQEKTDSFKCFLDHFWSHSFLFSSPGSSMSAGWTRLASMATISRAAGSCPWEEYLTLLSWSITSLSGMNPSLWGINLNTLPLQCWIVSSLRSSLLTFLATSHTFSVKLRSCRL